MNLYKRLCTLRVKRGDPFGATRPDYPFDITHVGPERDYWFESEGKNLLKEWRYGK